MSLFANPQFALPPPLDGTHFGRKSLISRQADKPQSSHDHRMSCDLSEILERIRPPDPELVDMIEQAFLEGQNDWLRADLAYLLLEQISAFCTRDIN